jgi:hypothetical protein
VRKPLSKRTRFEVFKRDWFACQYCGAHPPDALLEVDHIIPVCEGGANSADNLVTSCFNCNRGKGGVSLTAIPQSLSDKAAEIEEREAQILGYREIIQARRDRIEDDAWDVADALIPNSSTEGMRKDWIRSIRMFVERLPFHSVIDAAELASIKKPYSDKQRFLYFCGICWNKINRGEV